MPDTSPILNLPYILPAQAQKHVTHNEAIRLLDMIVQLAVASRNLTVPPAIPAIADRYIVGAGATGAWAGKDNLIAVWGTTGWVYVTPLAGWQAYVAAESAEAIFDGTTWAVLGVPSQLPLLGVNATADTTNRLTVSSPATLLNNAGAGHQLKVNKAAVADTASLLFQTGFSGRAEMGLTGNDDFSVRVSANGSAFNTALQANAGTGAVTLPQPMRLGGQASDPASPVNGTLWLNTMTGEVKMRSGGATIAVGASGVSDGDKGDVTVSGAGATWTLDAGAVSLSKMANLATSRLIGRVSAGTGVPEALTAAQVRGLLNVADGAQANVSVFADTNFGIVGNLDATKIARFNVDGFATATTQTFTLPNTSATLAHTGTAPQTFTGNIDLSTATTPTFRMLSAAEDDVTFGMYDLQATPSQNFEVVFNASSQITKLKSNSTDVMELGATIGARVITQLGVGGATGDTTNRLSVNTPGVLLNHAGTSIDVVVNKNAAANTGTISFDTGLSQRAMIGLAGTDDFTIRVSPDGATTYDAITVARTTGRVTIDNGAVLKPVVGDLASPVDGALWYNATTSKFRARQGGAVVDVIGSGGGGPVLGLADWWDSYRIVPSVTQFGTFGGVAISAGVNSGTIPTSSAFGHNAFGAFLRSSTTANSGYRYMTSSLTTMYFGGGAAYKLRIKFLWRAFTTNTVRLGFHDTANQTDAVDGAYFEINGNVIAAKTASSNTRTQAASTYNALVDAVYTFDIDVNAAGTSAQFRVYENLGTTPVLDQTITTNIPNSYARAFGAGIVATNSGVVAADIGILYELGIGTVPGFQRAMG